jgi:hypothetical protein
LQRSPEHQGESVNRSAAEHLANTKITNPKRYQFSHQAVRRLLHRNARGPVTATTDHGLPIRVANVYEEIQVCAAHAQPQPNEAKAGLRN